MMTTQKNIYITLNLKSYSSKILNYYCLYLKSIEGNQNVTLHSIPTKFKKLTVLRSPHKYKKAQEHYEMRIYKTVIQYNNISLNILKRILANKPQSIHMSIKIRQR